MTRLCGAHASAHDPTDADTAFHKTKLFAGAALPAEGALPDSVDATGIHTFRVQPAASCVATSICEQVQDMAAAQGQPVEFLSDLWVYGIGRVRSGILTPGVGLPDAGSNYRDDAAAARDNGMVAESVYSGTPQNITRVPPARIWQEGGIVKVGKARRILPTDLADFRNQIQVATSLAKTGQCSIAAIVMPVDDAYANIADGAVYSEQGPLEWNGQPIASRPTHCQVVLDYDKETDSVGFASTWTRRVYRVSVELLYRIWLEGWIITSIERVDASTLRKVSA